MTYPVTFGGSTFVANDFEGYNYSTNWERFLSALEQNSTDVENWSDIAAAAASSAASSLALALQITGGAVGVGYEALDLPMNTALGSAAFHNYDSLIGVFPQTISAGYQVTPADWGKLIIVTTGTVTVTLPLIADVPPGWFVLIKNRGGTVTVSRNGATLNGGTSNLTVSTGVTSRISRLSSTAWESF